MIVHDFTRVEEWPLANGDKVVITKAVKTRDDHGGELGTHFTWHVRARNGQIVAAGGETFTRKWSAKRAAMRSFPKADSDD